MVLLSSERTPDYDPSKPDPRLLDLVRLLARQAARDFLEAEWEHAAREKLHK